MTSLVQVRNLYMAVYVLLTVEGGAGCIAGNSQVDKLFLPLRGRPAIVRAGSLLQLLGHLTSQISAVQTSPLTTAAVMI